eukprot:scaffold405461_cov16-Prasinocladus_malaysianus.AAC.1
MLDCKSPYANCFVDPKDQMKPKTTIYVPPSCFYKSRDANSAKHDAIKACNTVATSASTAYSVPADLQTGPDNVVPGSAAQSRPEVSPA